VSLSPGGVLIVVLLWAVTRLGPGLGVPFHWCLLLRRGSMISLGLPAMWLCPLDGVWSMLCRAAQDVRGPGLVWCSRFRVWVSGSCGVLLCSSACSFADAVGALCLLPSVIRLRVCAVLGQRVLP